MSDRRGRAISAEGLRNRFRYRFDNLLARGTWAVLLWLGGITLLAVLVSSALLTAFGVTLAGSTDGSWVEDFWQSLLRLIDPGTMAADVGWGRRLLSLVVTMFGILIAGTLIGLIASGVEQRVDAMRRGRSAVVESGHAVILGASARLPVVAHQLALARRGRPAKAIVVLAEREPIEVSDEVRGGAASLYGSRFVARWGHPARTADLSKIGVAHARTVIVLADEDMLGDAGVVKAVLAAGTALGGFDRVPIIAELSDPETAESLLRATGGAVHPVVAAQSVGRITAFALREPGLNQVVAELLDFHGCDIYVLEPGDGAGLSFDQIVFRFAKARPIGRMRSDGEVELNPDPQTRLADDDRLVVIADDDRPLAPASNGDLDRAPGPTAPRRPAEVDRRREHLLIIGWNVLGAQLLSQLDEIVAPQSSAEVVYDPRLFDPEDLQIPDLRELDVALTPSRTVTWSLGEQSPTAAITSIVLLGYRRGLSVDEADSRTLLNLMSLRRELAAREGAAPRPRLIVELLDAETVDLARGIGADDYVVSDAIASRLMVQLAEQPERRSVLLSLYGRDGPSVHLVDAADLGLTGEQRFEEITAAAYSSGLLAIGWRAAREQGGEMVLNPRASDPLVLGDGDQIVVIG